MRNWRGNGSENDPNEVDQISEFSPEERSHAGGIRLTGIGHQHGGCVALAENGVYYI